MSNNHSTFNKKKPIPSKCFLKKNIQLSKKIKFKFMIEEAKKWGYVDKKGNVFVILNQSKIFVESCPGIKADQSLTYFARKFLDVYLQVNLLEERLTCKISPKNIYNSLDKISKNLKRKKIVGDINLLKDKINNLKNKTHNMYIQEQSLIKNCTEKVINKKKALIKEAQFLSNQKINEIKWKETSYKFRNLLRQWKSYGNESKLRINYKVENNLWKTFTLAKNKFENLRKSYFLNLKHQSTKAKIIKKDLIKKADKLSQSQDWSNTFDKYKNLTKQWKKTLKLDTKNERLLWNEFIETQNIFFSARQIAIKKIYKKELDNFHKKEMILLKAQLLFKIKDINKINQKFEILKQLWFSLGKVPFKYLRNINQSWNKIEEKIKKIQTKHWSNNKIEFKDRARSLLKQLNNNIKLLENRLLFATNNNLSKEQIDELKQSILIKKTWIKEVKRNC